MADETHFIITPKALARYWAKVDKRGPDECWPWLASGRRGYGRAWTGYRLAPASHFALALDGRPPVVGAGALHSCDNPPCCNPRHLRWGTQKENMADCVERGRVSSGESHLSTNLTNDQARQIKCAKKYHGVGADLARKHGISDAAVSAIRRGRTWTHITN